MTCDGDPKILYAWAKNAPPATIPEGKLEGCGRVIIVRRYMHHLVFVRVLHFFSVVSFSMIIKIYEFFCRNLCSEMYVVKKSKC